MALEERNYDLNLGECVVSPACDPVGQTLVECDFRKKYGAVILSIIRVDHSILHNPPADTKVLADDILLVLGTPEQLAALKLDLSGQGK